MLSTKDGTSRTVRDEVVTIKEDWVQGTVETVHPTAHQQSRDFLLCEGPKRSKVRVWDLL